MLTYDHSDDLSIRERALELSIAHVEKATVVRGGLAVSGLLSPLGFVKDFEAYLREGKIPGDSKAAMTVDEHVAAAAALGTGVEGAPRDGTVTA